MGQVRARCQTPGLSQEMDHVASMLWTLSWLIRCQLQKSSSLTKYSVDLYPGV